MDSIHPRRRRNPEVWHQVNRLLTAAIFLVALIFVALAFRPEWNRRNELARQLEEEQAKLAAEQLLQKQRTREVHLLQTDPEYVEMIARDKLGVMREGEVIFRLDPPKPGPTAAESMPR
ncbi:MAG: septum formation initiator family protein [Terrimicrobiaceae bacterium]|nr:septum formation initiator family protein [Terrimicrobiaceae bacterium]